MAKQSDDSRKALMESQRVQVSVDGKTVWVHADDGSTVGRFSRQFGLDVHTTASDQLAGKGQCLHCTHEAAGPADWHRFCSLMQDHHGIVVDRGVMHFTRQELLNDISLAFLVGLRDSVGLVDLSEIVRRNAAESDAMVCHTHDFCDANVVMADAMKACTGVDVDTSSEDHRRLFGDAWSLARKKMPEWVDGQMKEAVSAAFLDLLLEEIGPDNLREVLDRNRRETSPLVCHSHDFCDANIVMAEAIKRVQGRDVDVDDEGQRRLWNAAWEVAIAELSAFIESSPACVPRPGGS